MSNYPIIEQYREFATQSFFIPIEDLDNVEGLKEEIEKAIEDKEFGVIPEIMFMDHDDDWGNVPLRKAKAFVFFLADREDYYDMTDEDIKEESMTDLCENDFTKILDKDNLWSHFEEVVDELRSMDKDWEM